MGGKYKRLQRAARAHDSGNEKKTTVTEATEPAGATYKQGTVKDLVVFDRTNKAVAEYVGVSLGPVALRAVGTPKPVKKSGQSTRGSTAWWRRRLRGRSRSWWRY